jgi:hypothetical protein
MERVLGKHMEKGTRRRYKELKRNRELKSSHQKEPKKISFN